MQSKVVDLPVLICRAKAKHKMRTFREEHGRDPETEEELASCRCGNISRPGFQVCRFHGAGKRIKTGRSRALRLSSPVVQKSWLELCKLYKNDPAKIYDLDNEIALVKVLISRLAEEPAGTKPSDKRDYVSLIHCLATLIDTKSKKDQRAKKVDPTVAEKFRTLGKAFLGISKRYVDESKWREFVGECEKEIREIVST